MINPLVMLFKFISTNDKQGNKPFEPIVLIDMPAPSIINIPIKKVSGTVVTDTSDLLAIEEPLEIRLEYGPRENSLVKNVSVTMRTPGNDEELASGFLFTEGIVTSNAAIDSAAHVFIACAENKNNVIVVKLKEGVQPNLANTDRNFYTTSSCGVCGKGSINAIRTVSAIQHLYSDDYVVSAELLYQLPEKLSQQQQLFADTGGIHASALFDEDGTLVLLREDVGRHNALDKLIGAALANNMLPLNRHILVLSGRASFELVQKSVMAGIKIIAAVGAPSSLAIELAQEFDVTLAGFLRDHRFNIYTAARRVQINSYENSNQRK
jgi:FdhD protein